MTELRTRGSLIATAFALIVVVGAVAEAAADAQGWIHKDSASSSGRDRVSNSAAIVSPRMDFEQWTPLGRGDPLKNDPTFDYLPPVLDKVHYWKIGTGSTAAAAVNRARQPTPPPTAAPATLYNRRFFLTDFSRKEPQLVAAYAGPYKRPAATQQQVAAVAAPVRSGYLPPPRPKTPLPMLTPPPYRWPTSPGGAGTMTTVLPVDVPTLVQLLQQHQHQQQQQQQQQQQHAEGSAGDSAAESKRTPDVRAPPPSLSQSLPPPQSSHSATIIKTLLDAEVDRTTVTTPAPPEDATTVAAAAVAADASPPPPFAHYRRPSPQAAAVTDGPPPPPPTPPPPQMYLIIQGHSKVKKYGLHASKSEDALSASAQPAPAAQDHNHVGHDGPDRGEPSRRRKRHGPLHRL